MQHPRRAVAPAVAILAATALVLTGCGSSPAATPSATAGSIAGADAGTWTPLRATAATEGQVLDLVPGQVVLIEIETKPGVDAFVTSSDESVAVAEQAEGTGAVTAVPAVIAKAPGTSTITVQGVDDSVDGTPPTLLTFTVQVGASGS